MLTCGFCILAGIEGSAEAAEPLNEGVEDVYVKAEVDGTPQLGKSVSDALGTVTEDLGLFTKLAIFAVIVGLCVVYVKLHTPRRTGYAGRHGAYEKSGLP